MIDAATREQIEGTRPAGLYAVLDAERRPIEKRGFDFLTGAVTTLRLMARVREADNLPDGVESITVRSDGKVVIYQFITLQYAEAVL